ncbi:hypothetical protein HMPREF1141_0640 [Clostridium sp. MSTE9]|nr:hypothetical protein HMPREF1141_0640 [Clostridium sp. MSTE9]
MNQFYFRFHLFSNITMLSVLKRPRKKRNRFFLGLFCFAVNKRKNKTLEQPCGNCHSSC